MQPPPDQRISGLVLRVIQKAREALK
jgi:hypothetical protein